LPLSSFRWNDVIFQSFKTGYLRTFDLGFALSLKGDISLSLYRYLGKKAYDGRSGFEIELETLYNRHLGLRNTQYASKMKERLKPAHDELVGRGFLESVSYSPMKSKKGEKVCYAFTRSVPAFAPEEEKIESAFDAPLPRKRDEEEPGDSEKMREEAAASGVIFELPPLLQQMLEIGLSANVAEVFFETMPHEVLSEQLDCLADRHPLNPAATFVSAVRGGWAPPSAYLARCEAQKELASNEQRNKKKHQQMVVAQQLKAENDRQEQQEMAALDKAFGEMPDGDREEIEGEVARRMQFVLDHLGREAAVNGWQATRRQILREWVEEGRDVTRGSHQSEQGSAGSANTLLQRELFWNDEEIVPSGQAHSLQPAASSDTQLDNTYIKLSLTQQQEIDAAVDKRLEEAGMLTMTKEHPGWLGVRRTVMRQSLSKRKPAG